VGSCTRNQALGSSTSSLPGRRCGFIGCLSEEFVVTSDEAACAFAAATYAASRLPRLKVPLYLGALFTAASRVYVGVHYPSDVAAGALLGMTIARVLS
jgi:undecaprenyl-diphosphatase